MRMTWDCKVDETVKVKLIRANVTALNDALGALLKLHGDNISPAAKTYREQESPAVWRKLDKQIETIRPPLRKAADALIQGLEEES